MIDSEIMLEIKDMKDEIVEAVKKIVGEQIKELERYIVDINKLQFDNIQKEVDKHSGYHSEHYKEIKALDDKITQSRESILKDVDTKIKDIGKNSRSNISTIIAIVAVLVAILTPIFLNL